MPTTQLYPMLRAAIGFPMSEEEAAPAAAVQSPNEYGTVRMLRGNRNTTAVFSRPRGSGEDAWQSQGEYLGVLPNTRSFEDRDRARARYEQTLAGGGDPAAARLRHALEATNDPAIMLDGGGLSLRQQELDLAQNPNMLAAKMVPYLLQSGVDPSSLGGVIPTLKSALGDGGDGGGIRQDMGLADAASTLADPSTPMLLKQLGVADGRPLQLGDAIGSRAGTLTPNDLRALQRIVMAQFKSNPKMLDSLHPEHPATMLLRQMLEPTAALNPSEIKSQYDLRRRDYYQKRGPGGKDPNDLMLGGWLGLPF